MFCKLASVVEKDIYLFTTGRAMGLCRVGPCSVKLVGCSTWGRSKVSRVLRWGMFTVVMCSALGKAKVSRVFCGGVGQLLIGCSVVGKVQGEKGAPQCAWSTMSRVFPGWAGPR